VCVCTITSIYGGPQARPGLPAGACAGAAGGGVMRIMRRKYIQKQRFYARIMRETAENTHPWTKRARMRRGVSSDKQRRRQDSWQFGQTTAALHSTERRREPPSAMGRPIPAGVPRGKARRPPMRGSRTAGMILAAVLLWMNAPEASAARAVAPALVTASVPAAAVLPEHAAPTNSAVPPMYTAKSPSHVEDIVPVTAAHPVAIASVTTVREEGATMPTPISASATPQNQEGIMRRAHLGAGDAAPPAVWVEAFSPTFQLPCERRPLGAGEFVKRRGTRLVLGADGDEFRFISAGRFLRTRNPPTLKILSSASSSFYSSDSYAPSSSSPAFSSAAASSSSSSPYSILLHPPHGCMRNYPASSDTG